MNKALGIETVIEMTTMLKDRKQGQAPATRFETSTKKKSDL